MSRNRNRDPNGTLRRIRDIPTFKMLEAHTAKAAEKNKAERAESYESNSDVQRWRGRSKDQRVTEAIDRQTKSIKEFNDFKDPGTSTHEKAQAKAIEIARKSGENV